MTRRGSTKPPRAAAAVAHDRDGVSRVTAQGYGDFAEQIIAHARQHGVFVHESPQLLALLMQVDLDQRIPPRLYQVIAELLIWLKDFRSPG